MDYKVYPLALTNPSWHTFIEVCKDVLGFSPTRGLDAQGLSVEKPSSFLACLDMNNDPTKAIRNSVLRTNLLYHVSASFIIKGDSKLLVQILSLNILHVVHKSNDEDFVIIVSGPIAQWYFAILRACTPYARKEVRYVFNIIYALFKDSGFGDVWQDHTRHDLPDSTFEIR